MSRFDDQSIVVTGAGSGFGEAIAKRFAAEGGRVMASDKNEAGLARVVEEIRSAGGQANACAADVSQESDIENLMSATVEAQGRIDILVNNAGYSPRQMLLWKQPLADVNAVFSVNVGGVFLGCKHAIPIMIDQGGGAIVNIASIGAVAPRPGVTMYNATKGAVLTLTKGLALEVARHNIRVNAVNPVAADTGFMAGATGQNELAPELRAQIESTIPRGRLAEPRDIAATVTFLASADADFLTGTSIAVDGGRSV